MKLWIDDVRPMPPEYDAWARTVLEAKAYTLGNWNEISVVDLGHDAGDYKNKGGDYIRYLEWLERFVEENHSYKVTWTFKLHTMNAVGRDNMQAIIERNEWNCVR